MSLYTFFIDRSLGGSFVAGALREAGHAVMVHGDEFDVMVNNAAAYLEELSSRWPDVRKAHAGRRMNHYSLVRRDRAEGLVFMVTRPSHAAVADMLVLASDQVE